MNEYHLGSIVPSFVGHSEGTYFDMDGSGAIFVIMYNRPTPDEMAQFEAGKGFEIRHTTLHNIIFLTAKIGSLPWVDATYTPHLSKNISVLPNPGDGEGLGLLLVLADCSTGKIINTRLLGLSERFSTSLIQTIKFVQSQPFDIFKHTRTIQKIFSVYTTKQIVKLSSEFCKFN